MGALSGHVLLARYALLEKAQVVSIGVSQNNIADAIHLADRIEVPLWLSIIADFGTDWSTGIGQVVSLLWCCHGVVADTGLGIG